MLVHSAQDKVAPRGSAKHACEIALSSCMAGKGDSQRWRRLTLAEGQAMDPQTRILLEQAWVALTEAAAALGQAPTERTGALNPRPV